MTRYYGPDHRDSLNAQFQTIRNTDYVDPANYSTNISNVYVDTRYVSLRTDATNAALSANTHVCNIQGISLSAINTITAFYDNSEAVAAAIYRDAHGYCEVLRNLTETVNRLSALLKSVKSDGSLITVNDLKIAFDPLHTANKIEIATALAGLYNPDGTINEENAQQFRDAMAEMGITDITDEELALMYKIFVYLTQELGMDPAEVIGDMPYIYNSAEFNQLINNPYVAGNSEAFWQNMAGIADRVRNAGDLSTFNYMLMVDNLLDENGNFVSQTSLDGYRSALEEMGIYDVTDEDIMYYIEVVKRMRELGYSDSEICELTAQIYNSEYLSDVGMIGTQSGATRNDVLDLLINDVARYINTANLAYGEVGYHEVDDNYTTYNEWYYNYNASVPWCSVFVTYCANSTSLINVDVNNRDEDGNVMVTQNTNGYSAYVNMAYVPSVETFYSDNNSFSSRNSGYVPRVGDFVTFRGTESEHIGLVVGYDAENDILYTVEGNSSDSVAMRCYHNATTTNGYIYGYCSNGGDSSTLVLPDEYTTDDFSEGNNYSTT